MQRLSRRALRGGGAVMIVVLAALVVLALLGWPLRLPGAAADKAAKSEVALEFAAREVVQPRLATLPGQLEFSGPLVAPQTAVLRATAGGTLAQLTVAEGSRVQAGQLLGRIELTDGASRLAERQAQLEALQALQAQADRSHASNERLAAQQFISGIALQNSRAALDSARANTAAAMAALETTRSTLRDGMVVAPIAGIVAKRLALPGEKVAPEQVLLHIVDLRTLELAALVGTHEVGRLQPGLAVQVQLEGQAQPVQGQIARIAPAAEPGTRSIGVTVVLANADEQMRAGQYAVARATLADPTERLLLPQAAVVSSSGQDHVWVIEGGALARRAVTLGRRSADAAGEARVEVLRGVTAASVVLAGRFDNLREGAKAVVVEAGASAATDQVLAKAAPLSSAAASAPNLK